MNRLRRSTANVPRKHRRPHINLTPGMKWCPKCLRVQKHEAFGAAADRRDGLSGWCRECRAECEKGRRNRDIFAVRALTRARYAADPAKWHAKVAVARAVAAGKIVKPAACPVCVRPRRLEAHHHLGYARENWLNVVWRCRPCHALEHKRGASATSQVVHAA